MRIDGSSEEVLFLRKTRHNDNITADFGTGRDLQIYHDGSNSYITDSGTGDLYIQGSDDIYITAANGEKFITCNTDGSVEIRYDNVKKFETTSYGINVTGAINADDYISIEGATNPYLRIQDTTNEEYLNLYSSDNESAIVYTQDTFKISSGIDFLNQTPRLTINSSGNVGIGVDHKEQTELLCNTTKRETSR